jgi:signal transduction histidine kinase
LIFSVEDTGIGMSSEESQKIFNRFHATTYHAYTDFSGSGLGLSICKDIANTLGGTLVVESKKATEGVQGWTKIVCTLPCEIQVEEILVATSPKNSVQNGFKKLSILIVVSQFIMF